MWQSIDNAPRGRKVAVLCANGHVDKAWWYECDARGDVAYAVRGWINGGRVLEGKERPVKFVELPDEFAKIEKYDDTTSGTTTVSALGLTINSVRTLRSMASKASG